MKKNLRLLSILTLALVFLASSAVIVQAAPQDKPVKGLSVKGNDTIAKEEILATVTTKLGDKITAEKLQQDLQNIYKLGYFYDVSANFKEEKDGLIITYELIENPTVQKIKLEGNTKFSDEQLLGLIQTTNGKMLNSKALSDDIGKIEKKYHDDGYVLAKVNDVAMDLDGTLTISLREGLIEDIKASGNKKTKDHVITRNFSKALIGQPFNINEVRKGMQKVYNLGYFEDVSMHLDPGSEPDKSVLSVDVKEGKTAVATVGGGYSSADGFSGFIQVAENNLGGKGQQLKVRWRFGGITDYGLSFFDPWVDSKQTSFGIGFYNQIREKEKRDDNGKVAYTYDEKSKGAHITLGRPTGTDTRTSITLRHKDTTAREVKIGNSDTLATGEELSKFQNDYKEGKINSVTFTIVKDTRDNWLDPREGYMNQLDLEIGGYGLGGDYDYTKYQIDLRKYIKSGKKNTWALRGFGGVANGNVPDSELFEIGGADTLRGYEDDLFEGTKALAFSTEYRIPLGSKVQGVLFADAGNAWQQNKNMDLGELKTSAGLGVRFNTPLGPLRLDYGVGEDGGRAHFSIGQAF